MIFLMFNDATGSFSGCDSKNYENANDCCSITNQCGIFEGDCDDDSECFGYLLCGIDNCLGSQHDCCYNPYSST